jgi:hypothetical protein
MRWKWVNHLPKAKSLFVLVDYLPFPACVRASAMSPKTRHLVSIMMNGEYVAGIPAVCFNYKPNMSYLLYRCRLRWSKRFGRYWLRHYKLLWRARFCIRSLSRLHGALFRPYWFSLYFKSGMIGISIGMTWLMVVNCWRCWSFGSQCRRRLSRVWELCCVWRCRTLWAFPRKSWKEIPWFALVGRCLVAGSRDWSLTIL